MSTKLRISAEAMALARDHVFANDETFMLALTEALLRQHHTATAAERVAVMNQTTAEHVKRVDADEIAKTRAEAATAERERIKAILTAPEAQSNEAFAKALAFGGDMPADAAIEALRTAPLPAEHLKFNGLRSADAPGGLVLFGADGKLALAEGPVISMSPEPPRRAGENTAKALWKTVIDDVNKSAASAPAAPAQAGAGRSAVAHLNHTAN